jgi:hypothetical protein
VYEVAFIRIYLCCDFDFDNYKIKNYKMVNPNFDCSGNIPCTSGIVIETEGGGSYVIDLCTSSGSENELKMLMAMTASAKASAI